MRDNRQPRVFIGMAEIAGHATGLQQGFTEIGVEALAVDLGDNPFGYPSNTTAPFIVRLVLKAVWNKRAATQRHSRPARGFWLLIEALGRLLLLLWAITRYDAFIFNSNTSFLYHFWDLPLLRLLRKRVVCVRHGSDSRPPYLNGAYMVGPSALTIEQCIRRTRLHRLLVRRVERYASAIIALPTISHFHQRRLVNFTCAGLARTYKAEPIAGIASATVRVLHFPSKPDSKGTYTIREAVARLRARGCPLEFIEISGRPNHEVRAALANCDFTIDQLYSDALMSSSMTEAALMGKPSLAGSYGLDTLQRDLPAEFMPPQPVCHPDQLENIIEKLIRDADYRREIGRAAAAFTQNVWSPAQIAGRYLRIIRGDIPQEWMYNPADIFYPQGYGMPETQVKAAVRAIIEAGGRAALALDHRPQLEQMLVDWAYA